MSTRTFTGPTTTDLVNTKNSEVDGRGLALVKEFQEQVVQISRVVVGEQADDNIDIPGKFSLHSENPATNWSEPQSGHTTMGSVLTGGSSRYSYLPQPSLRPSLAYNHGT
jgi:hypothetical protein